MVYLRPLGTQYAQYAHRKRHAGFERLKRPEKREVCNACFIARSNVLKDRKTCCVVMCSDVLMNKELRGVRYDILKVVA